MHKAFVPPAASAARPPWESKVCASCPLALSTLVGPAGDREAAQPALSAQRPLQSPCPEGRRNPLQWVGWPCSVCLGACPGTTGSSAHLDTGCLHGCVCFVNRAPPGLLPTVGPGDLRFWLNWALAQSCSQPAHLRAWLPAVGQPQQAASRCPDLVPDLSLTSCVPLASRGISGAVQLCPRM